MTERTRLPGCKWPFPSQAAPNHATNCIHFRGEPNMSDEQHPTTDSLPACSCPSPDQIPDGGHPRSCPRYEAPRYRVELDEPLEKGRRAVRAYDGDTLVLDGVLEPRRPQATLPAGVCNWTSPAGFERGMDARAQIEAEANRPPSDGWSSTPPPSGDMLARVKSPPLHHFCNWQSSRGWSIYGHLRDRQWMMASGWEFRPLDSAPAPGIHQAVMVAIMASDRRLVERLQSAGAQAQQGLVAMLSERAHWWRKLSAECQVLGLDDAGLAYEELAEDCMRAVVAWQGS